MISVAMVTFITKVADVFFFVAINFKFKLACTLLKTGLTSKQSFGWKNRSA